MAVRVCNKQGCFALTDSGYCKSHEYLKDANKVARDKDRASSSERGYGSRWRRRRRFFLAHQSLCVRCLEIGRVTGASIVDHIIPPKGDQQLFWDESNWQALCKICHGYKTAKEDGGFGNPISRGGGIKSL
jgi:5-methylcytosine-specific restriction protein A